MHQSDSPATSISIPPPGDGPQLLLVGKKGPAFSMPCGDCDGFNTVVTRRHGRSVTVHCACQLAAIV